MIIRSAFIRAGNVAQHLTRTDTNEDVQVVEALSRNAPQDLKLGLRLFHGISKANRRTVRAFMHLKVSPSMSLSEEQFRETLEIVENEFGIPDTVPRIVVQHVKPGVTGRPAHIHVVYPIVDPASGRAISSHRNFFKDEIASRLAEMKFGEKIGAGCHQTEIIDELTSRGRLREVDILVGLAAPEGGARANAATRQQAERVGVNRVKFESVIFEAFRTTAGNWAKFEAQLARVGIAVARGHSAILFVDAATGYNSPVARTLRRLCKAEGISPADIAPTISKITERLVSAAYPQAEPFELVRDRSLQATFELVTRKAEAEWDSSIAEATADEEVDVARRLRVQRELAAQERRVAFSRNLKKRRQAIRAARKEALDLRTRRLERAFKLAGIAENKLLRRVVLYAAGLGIILAGGGLGLALIGAGFAVAALPSRERARALALQSRLDNQRDHDEAVRRLAAAYDELSSSNKHELSSGSERIAVPHRQRLVAAALTHLTIRALDGPLSPELERTAIGCKRVLGPELASRLGACVVQGERQLIGLLRAYDPARPEHVARLQAEIRAADPGAALLQAAIVRRQRENGTGR